jgi:hypothetical protein
MKCDAKFYLASTFFLFPCLKISESKKPMSRDVGWFAWERAQVKIIWRGYTPRSCTHPKEWKGAGAGAGCRLALTPIFFGSATFSPRSAPLRALFDIRCSTPQAKQNGVVLRRFVWLFLPPRDESPPPLDRFPVQLAALAFQLAFPNNKKSFSISEPLTKTAHIFDQYEMLHMCRKN